MKEDKLPLWSMSFLVTGNVLGVGILALPIKTGLSGFWPTMLGVVAIWLLMTFTALIIAKRIKPNAGDDSFDIPSFYGQQLGGIGKWVAIVANLILLYGVLTAYLSMIATMIFALFPFDMAERWIVIAYFILASALTIFGRKLLQRSATIVIILLWVCFFILLFYASKEFDVTRLSYTHWIFLSAGLPVIVSAFHFHNIVPTVCRNLKYNMHAIRKAIFIGTFFGFIMNVAWVIVVLGGLPMIGEMHESVLYAYQHGEPATVPISQELNLTTFTLVGGLFAILSVTASYIANGTGLLGFIRDLTVTYFHTRNRVLVAALSFVPPIIIALVNPEIFLAAIGVVGGIGEVILFGILPAIVLMRFAKAGIEEPVYMYWVGMVIFAISAYIFAYELGDITGLINISPQ